MGKKIAIRLLMYLKAWQIVAEAKKELAAIKAETAKTNSSVKQ